MDQHDQQQSDHCAPHDSHCLQDADPSCVQLRDELNIIDSHGALLGTSEDKLLLLSSTVCKGQSSSMPIILH